MGGIGEILDRLRPHVQRTMGVFGTPGLALALTSRRATLGVETFGAANLDSGAPVAPSTLFEIGSIGKSFTAAVLMQLAEEGAADLHAAVSAYLPWFSVRSRFVEPITLHHLLTHTGGLVRGADITSDSLFDVWAVGRTETGSPPGVRFHYSNVGYRVLGAVLEAVTGQPYPELIRTRVLERVGMSGSERAQAERRRQPIDHLSRLDTIAAPEHGDRQRVGDQKASERERQADGENDEDSKLRERDPGRQAAFGLCYPKFAG
jgi:CubicO group peptidase (beta-lactamase class C family)